MNIEVKGIATAILLFIVLKVNMGSLMRVFMVQLTGSHLCIGIGYFLIGGFFGAGDWGNVFTELQMLLVLSRLCGSSSPFSAVLESYGCFLC